MLRLLSLIISCLCLQHAVAQTDSSQYFERFKTEMESSMDKHLKMLSQPLPNWFTTPFPNEYVGCSFPSDDVNTRHETAILCALLNYLASSYKIYDKDINSRIVSDGTKTTYTSIREMQSFFNFQLVRTEVVGEHTFVSLKVDTIGGIGFGIKVRLEEKTIESNDVNLMESKTEIETTQDDHTIIQIENTSRNLSFSLANKKKRIYCLKEGTPVENGESEAREWKIGEYHFHSTQNNDDIGFVFWQTVFNVMREHIIYTDDLINVDDDYLKYGFDIVNVKNELVNGNLHVYFKTKIKSNI